MSELAKLAAMGDGEPCPKPSVERLAPFTIVDCHTVH